ncbi:MAG TPA: sulfotransferase [Allosphingosinicella sp.]|nr:sulfotransferase [Allosphingosinicella sp.]
MALGNGNGGHEGAVRDPETDRARLRAVHGALTSGDIAAAGKMAEDALADGIDHVIVLSLVAGRREEEGRLDEALALLRRAKAAAPDAAGILNQVGLCLIRMERWDEAVAEFGEALARDSGFAPALANRATAQMALGRLDRAHGDFEAAAAIDPANLVAVNGLAALALRRGDTVEARALAARVLAREPGFPEAVMTRAGADLADGLAEPAQAALRGLIGDTRLGALDRALAHGLLGDALDAEGRFADAFDAWRTCNALQQRHYEAAYGGRAGTLALVRELTAALAGRRIPAAWGHGDRSPAKGHVFVVGFPRPGTTPIERMLEGHPEIVTLADKECLIDSARAWMGHKGAFEAFCDASDDALETYRAAYWKRVGEEGVASAGRVFVDRHPFNAFKLPLIARLFPAARVLFVRDDPRDIVLSCFRHRLQMSGPAYQLLTLEGAADVIAATMLLAEASEKAFALYLHDVVSAAVLADFDGEAKAVCDHIGVARPADGLVAGAAGTDAEGAGRWRDYEAQLAPVLPVLAPWLEPFTAG